MFLRCPCGYMLTNVASPGTIVHQVLTDHGVERLQDAVDGEVAANGSIDSWPEHFEAARAIETWVCPKCLRLFVGANGAATDIIVYKREAVGLRDDAIEPDSKSGNDERELVEMALQEHVGESPLAILHPDK